MIEKNNLYEIWIYLQSEPLSWLTLTIGSYIIGDFIYKKFNLFPLFNPVAISIIIISSILLILDIKYERYFSGAQFIHFLLGPVTVALAIPIYKKRQLIQSYRIPIMLSLIAGCSFAIMSTYFISIIFIKDSQLILSLLPRNVTAPIAMGISEVIGGIPSITAVITIITGIIGASFGTFILDWLNISNMPARGFAIGLASHGIGTARAMSRDKNAGVFSALAMGLSGIVTSLLVPIFVKLLFSNI